MFVCSLQDILPKCLEYCESALQHDANLVPILKFLCELCLHFDPVSSSIHEHMINMGCSSFVLNFANVHRPPPLYNTRSKRAATKLNIVKHIEVLLDSGLAVLRPKFDGMESDELHMCWAGLVCLKYIRFVYM